MMQELYVEHPGWLQCQAAGRKLGVLLVAGSVLFLVRDAWVLLPPLVVVAALLWSTGVGFRRFWRHSRGLWLLCLAVVVITAWLQSPEVALVAGLRLLVLVGLALVVSFTTRAGEFVDAIEAGLQPLQQRGWVRADRLAFAIALTLRFVPELQRRWHAIREAQAARGIRANPVILIVPLVVAVLQSADAIAEAIEARGFDN